LVSCGGDKGQGERTVFRYNESAGITTLDPAFARDQATIWVTNQLYNGLLQLDDDLNIRPAIAKRWEISDGGLTYTFFLRDDVVFHDHPLFPDGKGRQVTAADFVYSFNRIVDANVASPGAWIFNNVARNEDHWAFEALNDTTLRVHLQEAFPPFLGLLTMQYCSVLPREIVEHYGKDYRKNPVGTGPFMFKMWKEGVKLVLLKNPAYFEFENEERLPYLDAVAITFLIDKQSVFLEFIKGKLDFMSGIDASYKDELLTKKGALNPEYADKIYLVTQPYLNTEYLGFLMDETNPLLDGSPLKDKRIRQAMNYGFDRRKMMMHLRNNIGTPAVNGFVPAGMPGFDSIPVKGYDYDPDRARKLLQEAGYPNGRGLPEITLTTTSSYLDLCEFIQHQLNELGFTIRIDVNPPATLREVIAKSKVTFFRGSWIADYPDAENYLSLFYSPNFCPKGPNYTHFSDPVFDSMYIAARNETHDSLRFIIYRKMDQRVIDQAPVIVLYYDQILRFVQKNISGLGSNPLNLLNLKRVKKLQ